MKKQIHREIKNGAYFVREPEVALTKYFNESVRYQAYF